MARISFYVFLVAAAIGLCVAGDIGKCKVTPEDIAIMKDCFKEVMDKDIDFASLKENPLDDDKAAALRLCCATKHGLIDESGKYDAEKSKQAMEAAEFEDDETKAAVIGDLEKCDADPGHDDVPALLKCQEVVFVTHCLPKP